MERNTEFTHNGTVVLTHRWDCPVGTTAHVADDLLAQQGILALLAQALGKPAHDITYNVKQKTGLAQAIVKVTGEKKATKSGSTQPVVAPVTIEAMIAAMYTELRDKPENDNRTGTELREIARLTVGRDRVLASLELQASIVHELREDLKREETTAFELDREYKETCAALANIGKPASKRKPKA